MTATRLDVIVPCFRQGPWLEMVLESVDRAVHEDHTVVVVDDASPDRLTQLSLARLKPSSSRQRLEIIHRKSNSGGVGLPRNDGFSATSSETVLFLDADDLLVEDSLAMDLNDLIEGDCDVSIGPWSPFSLESVSSSDVRIPSLPYSITSSWVYRHWERGLSIPIHSALFRRSSLAEIEGPFNPTYGSKEDFDFWTRYFSVKRKIHRAPLVRALYRTSPNSMSQNNFLRNGHWMTEVAIDLAVAMPELRVSFPELCQYIVDFYGSKLNKADKRLLLNHVTDLVKKTAVP